MVARARHQQPVELQEMSRRRQSLRRGIIEGLVSRDVDAKRSQARNAGKLESALAPRGQFMNFVLKAAGPHRLEREPIPDLGQCTFAFQACVKDFNGATQAPASTSRRATRRTETGSRDAPDRVVELNRIDRIQRIENRSIVNPP